MAAPGENLRINGERLWDSLMEMAKIGPGVAGEQRGAHRGGIACAEVEAVDRGRGAAGARRGEGSPENPLDFERDRQSRVAAWWTAAECRGSASGDPGVHAEGAIGRVPSVGNATVR